MTYRNLIESPIQGFTHALPQPLGGVAPLRHDLALTRYLEKQAVQRASSGSRRDNWDAPIRLCTRVVQVGLAALRGLRAPAAMWRRISVG